jgi:hypothetical protein
MTKWLRKALIGIGGLAVLAVLMTLAAPKAVHAIVSTLVTVSNTAANPVPTREVIPSQPFFATLQLFPGTVESVESVGPGASGRLAVTNITISAFSVSQTQQVNVFAPLITTGGTCGDAIIAEGGPSLSLLVPQAQTLSISYPTPLVFAPINGLSCLAAQIPVNGETSGEIEVNVTGFVQ